MQRNQRTPPAASTLRYSRHQHQEFPFNANFDFRAGQMPLSDSRKPLDLSTHLPPRHSSNRFDVLNTLPTDLQPNHEYHAPIRYRRARNSRGTKEAKRRRDARRNKRKHAAQMLNEQLSRDIDAVLTKINDLPQLPTTPPTPRPATPIKKSASWLSMPLPPMPPQLPVLEFDRFGLDTVPKLTAGSLAPISPPLTPPATVLPSWCPALPALTRRSIWSDDLPVFYDLSSLPEPRDLPMPKLPEPNMQRAQPPQSLSPSSPSQELQLWRGLPSTVIKKKSRFFPVPPPKPRVKLPATACKLHLEERLLPQSPAQAATYAEVSRMGVTPKSDLSLDADEHPPGSVSCSLVLEPSAANLWNILLSQEGVSDHGAIDPYQASFLPATSGTSCTRSLIMPELESEQTSGIAELDGREIPYVHANSLTGEVSLSPYADEHPSLEDSATQFEPMLTPPESLNELMVDYDIGYCCSSAAVNTPVVEQQPMDLHVDDRVYELADVLPVDCCAEADGGQHVLASSDAHFQSEKQLFELSEPTTTSSSADKPLDVAAFLKLGHARNCWCKDCETDEDEVPDLVSADKLTETDDEWVVYSAADNISTTTTQPASDDGDGERSDLAYIRCGFTADWDHPSPWKPYEVAGVVADCEWDWETEF